MKNNSTRLLITIITFALTGVGEATAAPGADNPGLPGQVQRNAADIADNFSQIQGNRADIMDLDERVSDLEAGGGAPGGERSFVEVDCTINGNADALLTDGGASIYFPPNTTYNIHGACNGPLFVVEDGVRFVGVDGSNPAIVLPADAANPGDGTVFVDGANDVRVQNLLIDASAWGSGAVAEGTDAAGIYARNAFVRVIDTRIVGGLWSINPFRNAIVRTQGLVELVDFVNAGISVGDQSLVSGRGPLNISSNVTDGNYLTAIEAFRGGLVDLRSGVTVNLTQAGPFPNSITATQLSQVRIRSGGFVDLNGAIFVGSTSTLRLDGGTLSGEISARENSSIIVRNLLQDEGGISLASNASANFNNSTLGNLFARANASVGMFGGQLNGANLDQGAVAQIIGVNVIDNIFLFSATSLSMFQAGPGVGSLNGNTVFKCGLFVVAELGFNIALTGNLVEGCGP